MIEDALRHIYESPFEYILGQASFALHDILVRDVVEWSRSNSIDIPLRIRSRLFNTDGSPSPIALQLINFLRKSSPLISEDHISLAIILIRITAMDLFTHTALSI